MQPRGVTCIEDITSVEAIETTANVYPNPFVDFVTITAENIIESIVISTVEGKIVLVENTVNTLQTNLDISDLSKGMYVVTVKTILGAQQLSVVK